MESQPNSHSTRYLLMRAVAAVAVVAAALVFENLLLSDDVAALRVFDAKIKQVKIESELLDKELPAKVVVPVGAQSGGRSLVVFLHERGGDEDTHVDQELLRALDEVGGDAPIIAFPRGGSDSYWHDRDDDAWGSYVLSEVVPQLRKRLDVKRGRVIIAGISMGGYGAYNLARQEPGKFCAVAGHAPAIWEDFDETAPGAFDGPEDFARNDVIEAVRTSSKLKGERAWVDAGTEDPFRTGDEALLDSLDAAGARTSRRLQWSGGHETAYWSSHWRSYIEFYARALGECARQERAGRRRAAAESDEDEKAPTRSEDASASPSG